VTEAEPASAATGPASSNTPVSEAQRRKLRQAAFVYLHLGVLYESAVFVMARRGLLGDRLGTPLLWLFAGSVIVAGVFWALWSRQSVWVARGIWLLGLFRIPTLIASAFFPLATARVSPGFYVVALLVVLVNAWILARAGWDL
jgi:hypothetical protein